MLLDSINNFFAGRINALVDSLPQFTFSYYEADVRALVEEYSGWDSWLPFTHVLILAGISIGILVGLSILRWSLSAINVVRGSGA